MKRAIVCALMAMGMMGVAGCLPLSLQPLYEGDEELVNEPLLVGTWRSGDADENGGDDAAGNADAAPANDAANLFDVVLPPGEWTFAPQGGEAGYALTVSMEMEEGEPRSKGHFRAALVDVDGTRFLDVVAAASGEESDWSFDGMDGRLEPMLLVRAHTFWRVDGVSETELTFSFLDTQWLDEHLGAHPDAVAHVRVEEGVLLTAASAEMRQFLKSIQGIGEAWSDPAVLTRKAAEPAGR